MMNGYHYTSCGLDYVYLENGYEIHETPHGRGVAIKDARELHETIALEIITRPERLCGQEVRFLRSLLGLSQDHLARKVLRQQRGSVARWEAEPKKPIPGPADAALRWFYTAVTKHQDAALKLVELLQELDELEHAQALAKGASFGRDHDRWRCSPALAA